MTVKCTRHDRECRVEKMHVICPRGCTGLVNRDGSFIPNHFAEVDE